jgi:uncharacterized protein YcbX
LSYNIFCYGRRMSGVVTRISVAPIKGLSLHHPDAVELARDGVPGDRAFFIVDERNEMVSATRLGPLVSATAEHDPVAGTLAISFADGTRIDGEIVLGEPEAVKFFGLELEARPVAGGYSAALSELVGKPVRLVETPGKRAGVDRGAYGAATLISRGSLTRLAEQLGESDVDARRFRMTFEIDGVEPHAEDGWIEHEVRIGEATVKVGGNVGRCALTTRNPDTGVVDLKTLHALGEYRDDVPTTEPLPFGVHAAVVEPGRVAVGDSVAPL